MFASELQNPANIRIGVPDGDWSREELDARAVWENSQIKPRHSPHYWLLVVEKAFDSGRWISWRAEHRINRTRCERAQLLARAFGSADEVADLPVLAAVALACERLGLEPTKGTYWPSSMSPEGTIVKKPRAANAAWIATTLTRQTCTFLRRRGIVAVRQRTAELEDFPHPALGQNYSRFRPRKVALSLGEPASEHRSFGRGHGL